jgi:hypothetical protein
MNPKEFHTIGLEYFIQNIFKISIKWGKHNTNSPCLPNLGVIAPHLTVKTMKEPNKG